LKNLHELSGGQLKLDENFNLNKVEFKPQPMVAKNNRNNKSNNNNNKGRQNNNRPRNAKQRH